MKKNNSILFKIISSVLLAWLAFSGVRAQKVIIYGDVSADVKLPPFRESFQALAKNLADLINEGWEDIYYHIYSGFMASNVGS